MSDAELVVDIVEIRRHTGTRRDFSQVVDLDDLTAGDMLVVDGRLALDLVIEAVTEGIVVHGTLALTVRGPCRRCLADVDTPFVVDVREIFESSPSEGETWPIDDERIDLEPVVRETALLSFPLAPLCRMDCPGPEPDRFPTGPGGDDGPTRDPRWAALDDLELD